MFSHTGLSLGITTDRARLRLYVAGLTPKTIEVTAAHADGWLPIWPSRTGRGGQLADLGKAAVTAGRPMPAVAGYIYGVVGAERELSRHLRATLAWYVAANGTAYRRLFERYGFADEVARIRELWAAGKRDLARAAVSDEMLSDTTLRGTPAAVLRQAAEFRRAGIDRPVLRLPGRFPPPTASG
nr:LLM class flavin-dependent oxidoreductase [Actinomadura madurae]